MICERYRVPNRGLLLCSLYFCSVCATVDVVPPLSSQSWFLSTCHSRVTAMEISSLSINGFKCFRTAHRFSFSAGLNCLQGSNGIGKTSTIEALCCLFGHTSKDALRYTYVNCVCSVRHVSSFFFLVLLFSSYLFQLRKRSNTIRDVTTFVVGWGCVHLAVTPQAPLRVDQPRLHCCRSQCSRCPVHGVTQRTQVQ